MRSIVDYIYEGCKSGCKTREEIMKECPKFWDAVSQFCRDKNSEEGVEWLIAAWTCKDENEWQKYEKDRPFSGKDIREFEEKYLTDEAIEEIENLE